MYMIAGLGNPTSEYAHTRHNVGFDVVDRLAKEMGVRISTSKFKAECGTGMIGGEKVLLLKPQTYMNNSGEALRAAVDFYKIDPQKELIVIYDDISLEPGALRIRGKGSAGGHNGMKSIIAHLGTQDFSRVRVGIGDKGSSDLIHHVLGRFSPSDRRLVEEAMDQAVQAVSVMILEDLEIAQNKFN